MTKEQSESPRRRLLGRSGLITEATGTVASGKTDARSGRGKVAVRAGNVINDRPSFDYVTGPPRQIAGLYAYAQLDCLIELAHSVAKDFFARPQLYTDLDDTEFDDPSLAHALAALATRVGADERFPSREQRMAMYKPVFGSEQEPRAKFASYREPVLNAAAMLAQWGQATGIPMLRQAFVEAQVGFRAYLDQRTGASVAWSRGQALAFIADEVAYPILRSKSVVAVFGLTKTPALEWPYVEDPDGEKAVEEISKELREHGAPDLTADGFIATQRVALRGAEALAAVLDFKQADAVDPDNVDAVINRCYTWHMTLRARELGRGAYLGPTGAAVAPFEAAMASDDRAMLAAPSEGVHGRADRVMAYDTP